MKIDTGKGGRVLVTTLLIVATVGWLSSASPESFLRHTLPYLVGLVISGFIFVFLSVRGFRWTVRKVLVRSTTSEDAKFLIEATATGLLALFCYSFTFYLILIGHGDAAVFVSITLATSWALWWAVPVAFNSENSKYERVWAKIVLLVFAAGLVVFLPLLAVLVNR
ncbi:MAG: hypothetical protein MPK06_02605 [Alphaproteobacteria bacterium]|nr:hypothetical protein [Alphaproteobacteria bacterium]MDA8004474.1 hypothetical protein [Alphaproteobacteria bacterium]MDA8005418.1 hypothetical protein [Alphaproteobacteria bacterium]MDA8012559.1 hypothetical protein [Alphaproteobacteria bacterium]